jgi:hypothetical protein
MALLRCLPRPDLRPSPHQIPLPRPRGSDFPEFVAIVSVPPGGEESAKPVHAAAETTDLTAELNAASLIFATKNNPKAESSVHGNGQAKTREKSPRRFEE